MAHERIGTFVLIAPYKYSAAAAAAAAAATTTTTTTTTVTNTVYDYVMSAIV